MLKLQENGFFLENHFMNQFGATYQSLLLFETLQSMTFLE